MTGPRPEQDPYAAILAEENDPYASILEEEDQDAKPGSISNFFRSIAKGAVKEVSDLANQARFGGSSPLTLFAAVAPKQAGRIVQAQKESEEFSGNLQDYFGADTERTSGKIGETVGQTIVGLPLFAGLDKAARAAGTANKALGFLAPRTAQAGETALQVGTRAAAQAIPRNVITGVAGAAMLDPELVRDPVKLATVGGMSAFGAGAEGFLAARTFSKAIAEEASAALANGVAPSASPRFQDMLNQVDEIKSFYNSVLGDDPLVRSGLKPKPDIEVVNARNVKEWNPKIKKNTLLPSGEEVEYFAKEAADLNALRFRLTRQIGREYDRLQRTFSMDRLTKVRALEEELVKVNQDLEQFVRPEIGRAAAEQKGLKLSEVRNPRTVIKFGANTADNFGDGPYPFTEPAANVGMRETLTASPAQRPVQTTTGSAAEAHFQSKIDYGNAAAKQARANKASLLTGMEKIKYTILDDLLPMKKVDEDTYNLMTRFTRVGSKMHQATEEALYIPDGKGGYTKGPAALRQIFQEITNNPTSLRNWNDFVQAKQAVSGVDTPFDPTLAAQRIDEILSEFPDFARVYDQMWQPMQKAKLDMIRGYGLTTDEAVEAMSKNENFAHLARSTFGEPSLGFLRGRKNPTSDKLVADIFESEYSAVRALVYKGEQTQILRQLADAKLKNADLPGVEFVPAQDIPEIAEIIAKLPAELPETLKQAIAEATHIPKKGSNIYNFLHNGKRVTLKVEGDAQLALNNLFGMEPIAAAVPEGTSKWNPAAWLPKVGQAYSTTEKTISTVYSVYRDLFGGGLPLDALEASINAKSEPMLKGFKMLRDPVRGFIELATNSDRAALIRAHGGHTAMRFADPTAELSASSVEQLAKRANMDKSALRFADPRHYGRLFKEFAGNLSNSVRMGATLRAIENGASLSEAVDIGNRLLGDPFKRGAATAGLAKYIQFFNYPMQANARVLGNLTNPTSVGMALARGGASISVPTAAIWLWNRGDERIQKLRNDPFGSGYLYVRSPVNDEIYAFRKPFLYGSIFSTPVEQMLDALEGEGNEEAIQRIAEGVYGELVPNMMPLLAGAVTENVTGGRIPTFAEMLLPGNRDAQVIPRSRNGLLPEDQADAQASNLSRKAAEILPVWGAGKWENLFRSVFLGGMWKDFQALDDLAGDGTKPATFSSGTVLTPLLGGRKVNPSTAGQGELRKFYQFYNEVTPALMSLERAISNGQADRAQEIQAEHGDKIMRAMQTAELKSDIDEINAAMNLVKNTETFSPEEKREQLDYYNRMRIERARQANQLLKSLERQ